MANRFWVGGTGNWDATDTTHWAASSGGAGGETVPGSSDAVIFDASSGGGTVTVTAAVSVASITGGAHTGTVDFNGQTVAVSGVFSWSGTGARTLTLGAASITSTAASATAWNLASVTNLTFSGASSTITLSGATATFASGSQTYGTVIFSGSNTATITGNLVCTNLTKTGTANKTDVLSLSGTLTVSGTLTINPNSDINRVLIQSSIIPTARTITAAAVVITNTVDFQDITGAGAATWTVAGTGATYIGDCGGNSGITFTTPATQTYTGGTGDWSDVTKWTSRVPLPQDDVLMSGVTGGTITADMPRMGKSINWTGAAGTPAWATNSTQMFMYGSLTLISAMTVTGSVTFALSLAGRGVFTMTNAGQTWTNPLTIVAPGGTYTLQDNYIHTSTGRFNLINGTFVDGGFNVQTDNFASSVTTTRGLTMTGTWTFTAIGITTCWNLATTTGMTFSGSTATITFTGAATGLKTFHGGGLTYGTLTYTTSGATGGLNITGSNSFAAINFSDASNARSLQFTAATTTTIRNLNGFNVQGTSGKLMTVASITAATHTLSGANLQSCNYLHLTNSIAQGGGTWYAGANSTDNGGNTGWIFTGIPTAGSDGNSTQSMHSLQSLRNL